MFVCSEPKTVFSAPYTKMLTRRSKVDPFTERPLGEIWKVLEAELDQRMSNAPVKCFFSYRGINITTARNKHLLTTP